MSDWRRLVAVIAAALLFFGGTAMAAANPNYAINSDTMYDPWTAGQAGTQVVLQGGATTGPAVYSAATWSLAVPSGLALSGTPTITSAVYTTDGGTTTATITPTSVSLSSNTITWQTPASATGIDSWGTIVFQVNATPTTQVGGPGPLTETGTVSGPNGSYSAQMLVYPGPQAKIGPIQPQYPYAIAGGAADNYTALAEDQYGNVTTTGLGNPWTTAGTGTVVQPTLIGSGPDAGAGWTWTWTPGDTLGDTTVGITVQLGSGNVSQSVVTAVYPVPYLAGPTTAVAGQTVTYAVYLGDASGINPSTGLPYHILTANQNYTVDLAGNGWEQGGQPVSSLTIPAGASYATVEYSATAAGTYTLGVSPTWDPDHLITTHTLTLAVVAPATGATLTAGSGGTAGVPVPLTLTLTGPSGPAPLPANETWTLTTTAGTVYSSPSETTPITSLMIPAGDTSATVYLVDTHAGTATVTATGVYSASTTVDIAPGPFSALSLAPTLGYDPALPDTPVFAIQIVADDAYMNPVPGPLSLTLGGTGIWPVGTSGVYTGPGTVLLWTPPPSGTATATVSATTPSGTTLTASVTVPRQVGATTVAPLGGTVFALGETAPTNGQPVLPPYPQGGSVVAWTTYGGVSAAVGPITDPAGTQVLSSVTQAAGSPEAPFAVMPPAVWDGPINVQAGGGTAQVVYSSPAPGPVSVTLHPGWNYLGIPYAVSGDLGTLLSAPDTVAAATYAPGQGWTQVQGDYTPDTATALAVYSTTTQTIIFHPVNPQPNPVLTLSVGWHLIAPAGSGPEPVARLVAGLNPYAVAELVGNGLAVSDPGADLTDEVQPGVGYWVYVPYPVAIAE